MAPGERNVSLGLTCHASTPVTPRWWPCVDPCNTQAVGTFARARRNSAAQFLRLQVLWGEQSARMCIRASPAKA